MSKSANRFFFILTAVLMAVYMFKSAMYWSDFRNTKPDALMMYSRMLIDFICVVVCFVNINKVKFKGCHKVVTLWLGAALITTLANGGGFLEICKVSTWPLLFGATYSFVSNDPHILKMMRKLFAFFSIIGIYVFVEALNSRDFSSQTNMIYFLLLTAPVLLTTSDRKMRNILFLAMSFVAFLSLKRSVMLAVVLFWMVVLAKNAIGRRMRKGVVIALFIAVCCGGVVMYKYVDKVSGGGLSSRFDDEDITNGRAAIYEVTLGMIVSSSSSQKIIGHGHDMVRVNSPLEMSAHNEWLEILYDYGVVGVLLFLFLWVYLVRKWFTLNRSGSVYLYPYTFCLCLWSVMSLVSQLMIYVSYFLYLVMFVAAIEALTPGLDRKRKSNESRRMKNISAECQKA